MLAHKAEIKQLHNSSSSSVRWYNRPSFARKIELLIEKAPHPQSKKSQEGFKRQVVDSDKQAVKDVLDFAHEMKNSLDAVRRLFVESYSLAKRNWWDMESEEIVNWRALLNGRTDQKIAKWAAGWLEEKGLLKPVEKKYFETHELVHDNSTNNYMKKVFEASSSHITRAFIVRWLEAHNEVRKKHIEAPAPIVMGENKNPKATVADLEAFARDWVNIENDIYFREYVESGHYGDAGLNSVIKIMGDLLEEGTTPDILGRLERTGILDKPSDFDDSLCRKIAASRVSRGFAGSYGVFGSHISKYFVWRVFKERGYVAQAKGQAEASHETGKDESNLSLANRFLSADSRKIMDNMYYGHINVEYGDLVMAAQRIKNGEPVSEWQVENLRKALRGN